MALGDVLIEIQAPPRPSGATETYQEYIAKIKKAGSQHFIDRGIEPARYEWTERYDVPEDPAELVAFVKGLLENSAIALGDYTFSLASSGSFTVYCIINGHMDCYSTVVATPNPGVSGNDFEFRVNLAGGLSVTVPFQFVVRWWQSFPQETAP